MRHEGGRVAHKEPSGRVRDGRVSGVRFFPHLDPCTPRLNLHPPISPPQRLSWQVLVECLKELNGDDHSRESPVLRARWRRRW